MHQGILHSDRPFSWVLERISSFIVVYFLSAFHGRFEVFSRHKEAFHCIGALENFFSGRVAIQCARMRFPDAGGRFPRC